MSYLVREIVQTKFIFGFTTAANKHEQANYRKLCGVGVGLHLTSLSCNNRSWVGFFQSKLDVALCSRFKSYELHCCEIMVFLWCVDTEPTCKPSFLSSFLMEVSSFVFWLSYDPISLTPLILFFLALSLFFLCLSPCLMLAGSQETYPSCFPLFSHFATAP